MTAEVLQIGAIVAGGAGLARRADGRVVFVDRAAPGDRVAVEYTAERSQWARARVREILAPGPHRREPPCQYYERCGGCQLQHLTYEAQLEAKAGIVADALRRLGGLDVAPPAVTPSSREFEYRNRMTLVLRRDKEGVQAGYHAFAQPAQLVDVEHCPLAEPTLNRVWSALRAAWGDRARRLPRGRELRLTLRAGEAGAVGLAIEGAERKGDPEALLREIDGLVTIWALEPNGEIAWSAGAPSVTDLWGTQRIDLTADTFVQVNRQVAAHLDAHVLDACGVVAGAKVVDAYCGFGLRSLELARRGSRTVGIDSNRGAIDFAQRVAADDGLPARFVAARVERVIARELPADVVVLNPPRRGVAREVLAALERNPPARIVYVSCDPATLARDLKALAARFQLVACRAFDMFPQTAHVETVVTLTALPSEQAPPSARSF